MADKKDARTPAEVWADAEPLRSVDHGIRRIRIVTGQTHLTHRERLDRVLEIMRRLSPMLEADEARSADEAKAAKARDRELARYEGEALKALARGGEPRTEGDRGPELPDAPPAPIKPPGKAELEALAALERGGEPA